MKRGKWSCLDLADMTNYPLDYVLGHWQEEFIILVFGIVLQIFGLLVQKPLFFSYFCVFQFYPLTLHTAFLCFIHMHLQTFFSISHVSFWIYTIFKFPDDNLVDLHAIIHSTVMLKELEFSHYVFLCSCASWMQNYDACGRVFVGLKCVSVSDLPEAEWRIVELIGFFLQC